MIIPPTNLFHIRIRIKPVLWIKIWNRMDTELLPGSGIIVPDPNPAKSERADK